MPACWLVHHTHLVLVRTRTAQKERARRAETACKTGERASTPVYMPNINIVWRTRKRLGTGPCSRRTCVCVRARVRSLRPKILPPAKRSDMFINHFTLFGSHIARTRSRSLALPNVLVGLARFAGRQAVQAVRSRRRPTMAQYFNAQIYSHNTHASHAKRKACDDAHIHYGSARAIRHR